MTKIMKKHVKRLANEAGTILGEAMVGIKPTPVGSASHIAFFTISKIMKLVKKLLKRKRA